MKHQTLPPSLHLASTSIFILGLILEQRTGDTSRDILVTQEASSPKPYSEL